MMTTKITWAIKNRHNKLYIQGLTPTMANVTFDRGEALRFLTLEAARDERNGWSPRSRKSLAIMRITLRKSR